jgi:hypothetical protein
VIWLYPLALAGTAAIVAPILIHILVQRRAPPFPFPTLRFLKPTRLAAIRRHVLEDLPLVLVRAAILAVAAGALAGPYLVTSARRAAWNDRIARAIVGEGEAARAFQRSDLLPAAGQRPQPFRVQLFDSGDLRDGIARAVAWLEASPPARRELVVVAPFALGSVTRADLADVPAGIGIRLVRSGELPSTRSFAAPPVLDSDLTSGTVGRRDRVVAFNGPSTSVRESAPVPASVPVEIVAAADVVKRGAEATLAAVLSQRVPAPVPGRSARVVFEPTDPPPRRAAEALARRKREAGAQAGRQDAVSPWMADAIARMTILGDVSNSAGEGSTLVVTTSLPPTDLRTALLFRSIFAALATEDQAANPQPIASAPASGEREVLTIPDADLRAWERPAGDVRSPRLDTIERDDRRWWWAAALALLAVEGWLRRSQRERDEATDLEAERVA